MTSVPNGVSSSESPFAANPEVIDELLSGIAIPFLGAGANLCGRPAGTVWPDQADALPDGSELAEYLSKTFHFPAGEPNDLQVVAQYAIHRRGSESLFRVLRGVFDHDFIISPLHRSLARLPAHFRREQESAPLIVTTNYDDAMERALVEAAEPFDLLWYVAEGADRGRFLHRDPGGEVVRVNPKASTRIPADARTRKLGRTLIIKVHGAVSRLPMDANPGSYVIAEDHYIDYLSLSRSDLAGLLPQDIVAILRQSNFVFLGYRLRDWNMRVIFHRLWEEQRQQRRFRHWAVELDPRPLDKEFWDRRGVTVIQARLEELVDGLGRRLS